MSHLLNCHQKTISSTKPTGSGELLHNANVTLEPDVGEVTENRTKSYCLREGQMQICKLKWNVCLTYNLHWLQLSLPEQRQMLNSFPLTALKYFEHPSRRPCDSQFCATNGPGWIEANWHPVKNKDTTSLCRSTKNPPLFIFLILPRVAEVLSHCWNQSWWVASWCNGAMMGTLLKGQREVFWKANGP